MRIDITTRPEMTLYGIWDDSSDRGQARAIARLTRMYTGLLGQKSAKASLPLYVLTRRYDPVAGTFRLFVGGEQNAPGMGRAILAAGEYARTEVRPLRGLLWGPAIGRAKGAFFETWLPASGYQPMDTVFERHDERSLGKDKHIELFFHVLQISDLPK